MAGKGFCVKVQLDLHAVTCPGVWLCPNGKVALRISTLSSTLESHRVSPIFPLLFHDKFTFKKIFTRVAALTELQQNLEEEFLYAELIQWINPYNRGIILAAFETNLVDLLYPVSSYKGLLTGVDVDLLMEPTKYFPGIIVPKIEISTKTMIEVAALGINNTTVDGAHIINPKTISSKRSPCLYRKRPIKGVIRQRRVCHSQGKSRPQICRTTNGRYQCETGNMENSLPPGQSATDKCYHATKGKSKCLYDSNFKRESHEIPLTYTDMHLFDSCPVCLKYKCYFPGQCEELYTNKDISNRRKENYLKDLKSVDRVNCDRHCCAYRPNSPRSLEPTSVLRSKVDYPQDSSDKLYHTDTGCKTINISASDSYYPHDQNHPKYGFYKNLERFYKRMYKQAKLRAQEAGD